MNTLQTHFWAVRDYLAPVLRESKFKEHGRITPEEFVAAGDFLTYKFPTWTWSAASSSDAKYTRDFLPSDKQYLISRGVPCLRRVSQMEKAAIGVVGDKGGAAQAASVPDERLLDFGEGHHGDEVKGKGGEEDWLATHLDEDTSASAIAGDIDDIPDNEPPMASMTSGEEDDLANRVAGTGLGPSSGNIGGSSGSRRGEGEGDASGDIPDIPDMDDEDEDELGGLGDGVEEAYDPATARVARSATSTLSPPAQQASGGGKLVSVRTYDCLITYDKYYQTPRMWLVGYNEGGQPLKPAEIFEDVSSDYAQKTVTVEPFPHGSLSTASIHPCKHASVMKKVIERMNARVMEQQRKAKAHDGSASAGSGTAATETKKKKGWGLGGAMKKKTGAEASSSVSGAGGEQACEEEAPAEVDGLRVDQYLLIFLKFMASIVPAIEIDATQAV